MISFSDAKVRRGADISMHVLDTLHFQLQNDVPLCISAECFIML